MLPAEARRAHPFGSAACPDDESCDDCSLAWAVDTDAAFRAEWGGEDIGGDD